MSIKHPGIRLDIGCGPCKQPHWIGLDKHKYPGVDIVHDVEKFPYPLRSNSCFQVLLSHIWEHIEPKYRMRMMDEIWRIMMPQGQLLISAPYFNSFRAAQDPTHYPCPNEATFCYFDPAYELYLVYRPKPWKIVRNDYQLSGNLEVILEKQLENKTKRKHNDNKK